jgi:hypothetical protein
MKITHQDRLSILALRQTTNMSNALIASRFNISTGHLRRILRELNLPSQVNGSNTTMFSRQISRADKLRALNEAQVAEMADRARLKYYETTSDQAKGSLMSGDQSPSVA